ncbi:LysR family transcriptional regulator [Acidithiobacillus sp.]|jgi:DNA-binding transcriptional LysR family regulator|uniref:LysR family transcriptional regulator n=2 Tax=Acidithiobacillus sp. TaxID=1872118 RepID=UPI0025BF13BE|nr:LysR family transcriptional regulator [Acidithiobacillus sp.]MCK9359822.1 LysR family transcriptional regulator [Acidithiobacillus sp.]MCK9360110.1 LysR family transcriptional regulator [Acidithiobacillus sp.]
MDSLSGIMAFVRSAEMNSFVAASERLGVSASAISKSVARLEDELGVRLFNRSTRRLRLTEEGALFFERCRRIVEEIEEAEYELSRLVGMPRGKLRVSVPAIGYRMLMPVLREFVTRYPNIELDLDFNDRLIDMIAEGVDAAIRSGDMGNSQLKARCLGTFHFVLVGAPHYFASCGVPRVPTDLANHACLRYKFPTTGQLQEWKFDAERTGAARIPVPGTHTFNSVEALISASMAGLGIAYLPNFAVREAIGTGTLVFVLDEFVAESGKFSILWPGNRYMLPKLRVFVDFLVEKRVLGE